VDELTVTKILVTKGPTYKRSLPISRGRAHPIRKRTSHITVEVGVPGGETVAVPAPAKKEEAPTKKVVKKPVAKKSTTKTKEAK
ncbi:MAG: 50S ribosomal protein L22, partial [Candidatus Peregrinibacteria bacterium]|nr:50S ribosomal protein L22 [Candidatus Peregrinibacteria bacterium]